MKKLELDFIRRNTSPWAGRVLLAIAIVFTADVGLSYRAAQNGLAANQALAAKGASRPAAAKASSEELAQVRNTLARLSMPWDQLFGALEAASSEQVALLAVEPDPKAGTVVISGDSKDYLAALSYVLNLSRSEALRKVQLVRHEVKADDPQHAVAFTVTASWNGAQP